MGKDQKVSCQYEWLITYILSVSCCFIKKEEKFCKWFSRHIFGADQKE